MSVEQRLAIYRNAPYQYKMSMAEPSLVQLVQPGNIGSSTRGEQAESSRCLINNVALHKGIWETASVKSAYDQPHDIAYSDRSLANLSPFTEGSLPDAHQQLQNCSNAVPSMKARRHPCRHLHETKPPSCIRPCIPPSRWCS